VGSPGGLVRAEQAVGRLGCSELTVRRVCQLKQAGGQVCHLGKLGRMEDSGQGTGTRTNSFSFSRRDDVRGRWRKVNFNC
jgi:hypothetical protein